MKATSILGLFNQINGKVTYKLVKAYTSDLKEEYPVSSFISHQSRFNFTARYRNKDGEFRAVSLIKDGKLGDIRYLHCITEDGEVDVYDLYEMPVFLESVTLEDIVKSLLNEEYVSHRLSAYKELLISYPNYEKPARSYNKKSETPEVITPKVQVPCVTYQIQTKLEPTLSLHSLRESFNTKEDTEKQIKWHKEVLEAVRFKTRSLIYSYENEKKEGAVNWSEIQPLPRSKKKFFQEISTSVYDEHRGLEEDLVIRKTVWNEEVNI